MDRRSLLKSIAFSIIALPLVYFNLYRFLRDEDWLGLARKCNRLSKRIMEVGLTRKIDEVSERDLLMMLHVFIPYGYYAHLYWALKEGKEWDWIWYYFYKKLEWLFRNAILTFK